MIAPWTKAAWLSLPSSHRPSAGSVAVSWYGVDRPSAVSGFTGTMSVQFGSAAAPGPPGAPGAPAAPAAPAPPPGPPGAPGAPRRPRRARRRARREQAGHPDGHRRDGADRHERQHGDDPDRVGGDPSEGSPAASVATTPDGAMPRRARIIVGKR